jgi:hypothetical protein
MGLLWRRAHVAEGEPHEKQPLSPPPAPLPCPPHGTGMVRPNPASGPLPQLRRCSVKPPLRTKSVGTKVSEAEFAMLEERARANGLTLSEWVREVLLAGPVEVETGEIVLGRWPGHHP